MSSGGAVPPTFNPFTFPLFQTTPQLTFQQQQRYKIKRQRQRVDAGEPRNSYQGLKNGANDQLAALFPSWLTCQMEGEIKEEQPTDLSVREEGQDEDLTDELDQLDVEANEDKSEEPKEDERPINDSPASNESSSSSKRKQTQPQKNTIEITGFEEIGTSEEAVEELADQSDSPTPTEDIAENPLDKLTALQSQLTSPSLHEMMEVQRRLCSNMFEQQKKLMQQTEVGFSSIGQEIVQEKPRIRDFSILAQTLKTELNENLSGIVDRILKEWAADIARMTVEQQPRPPMPTMFTNFPQPNPLAFGMPPGPTSGIFPPFNGFNPLAALTSLRRPMIDDEIKRKRAKVTDSVRKLNGGTPLERDSPSSGRSSPQLNLATPSLVNYFPPTMVGHPLYGGAAFPDREDSPTNSDDNSDCGPYDASQSTTLTPMHLRKAKLMFFFTRYPNSTLLKSYFPDIRFNKNNTAQLVKWFSNFREFYYNQMDKFARNALAEGVTSRDQISVTMDSEIMKALNQHYNRNNHIQPPDRLVYVVQETLREFFDAIRMGKDSEASWKKTIYKIINRLDDPIPEFFKSPDFLERLEQQ